MRKLILASVITLGATSATLAAGGGGYDGVVVANVYEYLAAHGCPGAGFSLLNCPQSGYGYNREAQHHRKTVGDRHVSISTHH